MFVSKMNCLIFHENLTHSLFQFEWNGELNWAKVKAMAIGKSSPTCCRSDGITRMSDVNGFRGRLCMRLS